MQFKVPQFLDIEDKIFGPFTFREFVYLAGGAGLCFVLYKALGFWIGAIPIIIVGGFSALLTFYHPNGKPFINLIESGLKYFMQDKLFLWKRRIINQNERNTKITNEKIEMSNNINPRLSGSKLRDLSWSLDVLSLNKEEQKENK